MKRIWLIIAMAAVCLCAANAWAEPVRFILPVKGAEVEITAAEIDGEQWLMLPSFAEASALFPQVQETEEAGVWHDEASGLYLMQSAHLRTLFLFSDDPVHQGRAYIDGSPDHSAYTTGSMALVGLDGTVEHADHLRQLRGRGNGSWDNEKKPYQFKLENRADLLHTGEAARTWVLLAETLDQTFLHNRIALDLALEMGLSETSHSEFVDLYYDGEYRGLYLLAEKVEIDPARVDEMDYDKLIEEWNASAGIADLEKLDEGKGQNRYGNEYTFIEGLMDNGMTDAGAYLLEMEDEAATLSDRCWFRMDDGSVVALKNPENASDSMVRSISEQLTHARRVLQNGGVSPETGETIEDVFDVDAFARTALLYELSYSDSGFHYSSTYFVLPAGERRFRPGPVWDFDLTWRYYRTGVNRGGMGVKDQAGWLAEFYSVPAFSQRMKQIYLEEMVPLIQNVLLGEEEGRYLQPLHQYEKQIAQARSMNARRWEPASFWRFEEDATVEDAMENLRSFIDERSRWLQEALGSAREDADAVILWAHAPYAYVEDDLRVYACPWSHVSIRSHEVQVLEEATESEYALCQLEVIIDPAQGYAFGDPSVILCGTPVSHELLEDGGIRILVTFEDPSYRPVDYYGEDIGLIYNPDVYAANYPEIAAEYADDPEGLMDYFCDDGMYEDHQGNAFFRPSEVLMFYPEMMDLFGEDWQLYYWDFLYYGYDDGWLLKPGRGFIPEVQDAL